MSRRLGRFGYSEPVAATHRLRSGIELLEQRRLLSVNLLGATGLGSILPADPLPIPPLQPAASVVETVLAAATQPTSVLALPAVNTPTPAGLSDVPHPQSIALATAVEPFLAPPVNVIADLVQPLTMVTSVPQAVPDPPLSSLLGGPIADIIQPIQLVIASSSVSNFVLPLVPDISLDLAVEAGPLLGKLPAPAEPIGMQLGLDLSLTGIGLGLKLNTDVEPPASEPASWLPLDIGLPLLGSEPSGPDESFGFEPLLGTVLNLLPIDVGLNLGTSANEPNGGGSGGAELPLLGGLGITLPILDDILAGIGLDLPAIEDVLSGPIELPILGDLPIDIGEVTPLPEPETTPPAVPPIADAPSEEDGGEPTASAPGNPPGMGLPGDSDVPPETGTSGPAPANGSPDGRADRGVFDGRLQQLLAMAIANITAAASAVSSENAVGDSAGQPEAGASTAAGAGAALTPIDAAALASATGEKRGAEADMSTAVSHLLTLDYIFDVGTGALDDAYELLAELPFDTAALTDAVEELLAALQTDLAAFLANRDAWTWLGIAGIAAVGEFGRRRRQRRLAGDAADDDEASILLSPGFLALSLGATR